MKIGLDLRCLPTDGKDGAGIAHAARSLCSKLVENKNFEWIAYIPLGTSWNKCEVKNLSSRKRRDLRNTIIKNPCDLLFVPSGAITFNLPVASIPWVHDLIIFSHPEWFPQNWFKRQITTNLFLRGIKKAPLVFCVSEHTKKSILRFSKIKSDKILVTGEGGDEELMQITDIQLITNKNAAKQYVANMLKVSNPYILYLGTVEPRKNISMLIRAWKKSGCQSDLVIAGQDGWKNEDVKNEMSLLDKNQLLKCHRLKTVSEYDKHQLLLGARAVCVPSFDEGFGLVVLEALQAGTWVIASNIPSHKAILENVGCILDSQNEESWITSIKALSINQNKIFNSIGLANMVGALKGKVNQDFDEKQISVLREQAKKWSWDKAAEIVINGFASIKQ